MNELTNVIFLGTSQLLYNCARKVRNYYTENANIKVIDTSDSITQKKQKLQNEFGNTKEYTSKSEIFEYLEHVTQHTFLFSINNTYIVPKRVFDNPNLIMINLHHSLLPRHPGRNAEAWTIYDQDLTGGISWHYMNQGIDSGDIICQKEIAISEDMTSLKLLKLCEKMALDSFDIFLPLSGIQKMQSTKQRGEREIPKKAKDIPNNGELNLDWSIDKCLAFLNSLNYGAIDVLGFPQVKYQGTDFIVKKYQMELAFQPPSQKILYASQNNTLKLYAGGKCLILTIEKN